MYALLSIVGSSVRLSREANLLPVYFVAFISGGEIMYRVGFTEKFRTVYICNSKGKNRIRDLS